MKIRSFSVFCVIISGLFFTSCKTAENTVSFKCMDTFMTVRAFGKTCEKANKLVETRVTQLDNLLSTTNPESEVYKINSAKGRSVEISEETLKLVEFSLAGGKESEGAFNPILYPVTKAWGFTTKNYKVPSEVELLELLKLTDFFENVNQIQLEKNQNGKTGAKVTIPENRAFDFGAVGKGFASDEAIRILKENGVKSAAVNFGGNVQVLGLKPDQSMWNVGLRNPWGEDFNNGEIPVAVKVADKAVITSGGYERYFTGDDGKSYIHIFDGRTGRPVENNLVASTIITESGLYGDYLSTTTFILGKEKTIEMWRKNQDFDFVLIFDDFSICYSKGLVGKITLLADFSKVEVVE